MKLATRKRAIKNWQRLKVVLAILKICGNRIESLETKIEVEKEKQNNNRPLTFDEQMRKYILTPTSRNFMYYASLMTLMYGISFFLEPYIVCFDLYPILSSKVKTIQSILSVLMVLDIVLHFFTAFPKEETIKL